jgi:hypothetical protein
MPTPDNGKNIISSLNCSLLFLQYLLHNARFAVVALDGTGNYSSIQAAVAANEKTILVKPGTYSITSDLVLVGQSLISLSPSDTILNLTNATIELFTHTAADSYNTGSCTLTNNSVNVTGIATAWDTGANAPSTYSNPWLIGQGHALKVTSVLNDNTLVLEDQYRGSTLTMLYFLVDLKNFNSEISGFNIVHEPTAPRPCIKVSGIGNVVKDNYLRCDRVNTSIGIQLGAAAISVAHSCKIIHNSINSGVIGIELKNSHACFVSENTLQNQTASVIATNTTDGDCWLNKITFNNILSASAIACVLAYGSNYTEFSFNKLVNCRNHAVSIEESHYCNISNNTLDTVATTFSLISATPLPSNYLTFSCNQASQDIEIYSNYSTFSYNRMAAVYLDGSHNSICSNYFQSFYALGSYNAISANNSYDSPTAAIEVDGSFCTITANTIYKGTDYSIILNGTGSHTCNSNTIDSPTGAAIFVNAPCCSITGNNTKNGGSAPFPAAIIVDPASTNSIISNNNIAIPNQHGIYCEASDSIISDNLITDSDNGAGIYLENGDRVHITGNHCITNTTYGIFVANTSDRIVITSNICLNNITAQITNNGTNTEVAHNIIA